MTAIYITLPGMFLVGLAVFAILILAIKNGQYEDMDGDSQRILMDDDLDMMDEMSRPQSRQTPADSKGADAKDD